MQSAFAPAGTPASAAHVIQYPSGRWGFVGKVPASLAYEYDSEDDVMTALQIGPGIAARIAAKAGRTFKTRSWSSQDEALAAKAALEAAHG